MAIDKETETYQNVWKKAYTDGEVTLHLKTRSDLTNVRFKLYNVAKAVKRRPVGTDFATEDAVNNCSISADSESLTLRIYRKDKSALLQDIAAQIGDVLAPPQTMPADDEITASLKRLAEVQRAASSAVDENPRFNYPMRRNKPEET